MNHTLSKETEIAKLLILLRKETQKSVEKPQVLKRQTYQPGYVGSHKASR